MSLFLSETEVEDVVVERSLNDIYDLILDLSSDISGIKKHMSLLREELAAFQELISEKLDLMYKQMKQMPEYDQMEIVIAFLLMIVFLELMRLLKSWTNSFRMRGGK